MLRSIFLACLLIVSTPLSASAELTFSLVDGSGSTVIDVAPGATGTLFGIASTEAGDPAFDLSAYGIEGSFGSNITFTGANQDVVSGVLNTFEVTPNNFAANAGTFGTPLFSVPGNGGSVQLFSLDYLVDPGAADGLVGFTPNGTPFLTDTFFADSLNFQSASFNIQSSPTAIPEPGSMALAAMLAGGVGAYCRRRRAAAS